MKSQEDNQLKNYTLAVEGAIIHKGKETGSGHYTWWMKDNNECYVINDEVVGKSEEKYPKQGNVFLLKSKEFVD